MCLNSLSCVVLLGIEAHQVVEKEERIIFFLSDIEGGHWLLEGTVYSLLSPVCQLGVNVGLEERASGG